MYRSLIYTAIFTLMLSLNACSGDQNPENYLSFQIDGRFWESQGALVNLNDTGLFFFVEISAQNGEGESIFIQINSNNQSGTGIYPIGQNNSITYTDANGKAYSSSLCISGNIVIDDYGDLSISGNFNSNVCNGSETKRILEGNFIRLVYR